RQEMDAPADRAAKAIFDVHNFRGVTSLLGHMALNDSSTALEVDGFSLPEEVQRYLNDKRHFDFDEEQCAVLDRASQIFARHAPVITFNLAVRSLLKQYAAAKSTNVLRMTTLLEEHTDRRVTETFQFVLDVMEEGWYKPGKRGIRSIQILRLIHALIRFRILHGETAHDQGSWNPAWGQPINQEDMAFANNTFSVEVLAGLRQVGIQLSEDEQEDYYQAWVLIGKALGVNPNLQMPDLQHAIVLQNKIYDRQFVPNSNGPALADALVSWLIQVFPIEVRRSSIITFIKFFNGEDNYWIFEKILNMDVDPGHPNFHRHVHQDLAALSETERGHESLDKMSSQELNDGQYSESAKLHILSSISLRLLEGLFKHKRGSKSTGFQINDALADRWGLPGNEGIPEPNMPPLSSPKKRHPIISFFFNLGTQLLNIFVSIRDYFHSDPE
nr:DUF2236 domain-containing protein [Saprospiraceae bacterium]